MSQLLSLRIAGIGMITPLGGDARSSIAAIRAGVSRYEGSSFFNSQDKPMITTSVPNESLPELNEELKWIGLSGREKRVLRLAEPALKQALADYADDTPIPLFLAGPEILPGGSKPISAKLLSYLVKQTNASIDLKLSRYFAVGRAGMLEAIALAFRYFEATDAHYVLVGGVDSYLDVATLSTLNLENRVLAENTNDAFVPGEGACFLLLKSYKAPADTKNPGVALYQPGLGVEKGHRFSNEPYQGQGLSDAIRQALGQANSDIKISTIYSSLNGESFFAKEFGVATMRNSSAFFESYTHMHPADCYGDLGAATAGVLIALAESNLKQRPKPTQELIYCSSDLANRAAICLDNSQILRG